jgi:hypothetical protein
VLDITDWKRIPDLLVSSVTAQPALRRARMARCEISRDRVVRIFRDATYEQRKSHFLERIVGLPDLTPCGPLAISGRELRNGEQPTPAAGTFLFDNRAVAAGAPTALLVAHPT